MNELLPSFQEEETDSVDGHNISNDVFPNGHFRGQSDTIKFSQALATPLFPEVDKLLALFKDSSQELVDLRKQVCDLTGGLKSSAKTSYRYMKALTFRLCSG